MLKFGMLPAALFGLAGCQLIPTNHTLPNTLGEESSAYGYVPLDGLAVDQIGDADSCGTGKTWLPLLQALPDISTRFSVATLNANGSLTFGPAKVTASDKIYRAVLDYVNVDVIPQSFYVRKLVNSGSNVRPQPLSYPLGRDELVVAYEAFSVERVYNDPGVLDPFLRAQQAQREGEAPASITEVLANAGFTDVTIPIYVGIGMRLTADVRALKANIGLTSLAQIGAAAEADQVAGTLTVQTLGINGKSVATALPLPSKLDQTTIENGLLALGSSRALLYNASLATPVSNSAASNSTSTNLGAPAVPTPQTTSGPQQNGISDVTATPRIVGLYSPIGTEPALVNAIYSELSKQRPKWRRPC